MTEIDENHFSIIDIIIIVPVPVRYVNLLPILTVVKNWLCIVD